MTPSAAEVRTRVAAQVVGRERELDLLLAAVAAGRDVVLEGPPGTSKTTLLRAITGEWGIPLMFVEGNADLTPAKLIGHHNPARVLREDYSADNFVEGPLVSAMRRGGFLYVEEFNRAPEDTLNTLLTAMADRRIAIPRVGEVAAAATFRVIASMNPYDNVGTTRLSTSVHDRLCRLAITYQNATEEQGVVELRTGLADAGLAGRVDDGAAAGMSSPGPLGPRLIEDAVAVTRATRAHPDVRQGSSVRGAIDLVLVARELAALRGTADLAAEGAQEARPSGAAFRGAGNGASRPAHPADGTPPPGGAYGLLVWDAMVVALSGRIHLDEAADTTPEAVLREIWEDRFVLSQAAASPG